MPLTFCAYALTRRYMGAEKCSVLAARSSGSEPWLVSMRLAGGYFYDIVHLFYFR